MPKKPKAKMTPTASEMYDRVIKPKNAEVLAPDSKALLRAQCEQTVIIVAELQTMTTLMRQVKKLIDDEYNFKG